MSCLSLKKKLWPPKFVLGPIKLNFGVLNNILGHFKQKEKT